MWPVVEVMVYGGVSGVEVVLLSELLPFAMKWWGWRGDSGGLELVVCVVGYGSVTAFVMSWIGGVGGVGGNER
ncbi:hypothetical protein Tco_1008960 [Tanacetum coccineum]